MSELPFILGAEVGQIRHILSLLLCGIVSLYRILIRHKAALIRLCKDALGEAVLTLSDMVSDTKKRHLTDTGPWNMTLYVVTPTVVTHR